MTKIEHNKCLINLISECQFKNAKENSNRNLQCVTLLIHYDMVRFIFQGSKAVQILGNLI